MAKRKEIDVGSIGRAEKRARHEVGGQRSKIGNRDAGRRYETRSQRKARLSRIPRIPFSSQATFFDLPAELRNNVYGYVLDPDPKYGYQPTEEEPAMPGLLRTCRQMRDEALPMFLANRPGGLTIYDLELRPHFTHWYWTNTEKKLKFWFDGARSWANLKAWLHLFWQGRAPGFCCSSKPDAQNTRLERTLARAFVLVGEMMDAHQEGRKMLWSDIERMLETFREAVDDHPGGSFFAK